MYKNFDGKSKYLPRGILIKNQNVDQKSKYWPKIVNFNTDPKFPIFLAILHGVETQEYDATDAFFNDPYGFGKILQIL